MPVYACNNEITDVFYSGYTIVKIIGCNGQVVYNIGGRPVCDIPIARVITTGESWVNICDINGDSAVTRSEVDLALTAEEFNNIRTVQIQNGCVEIGEDAFKGATSLTGISSMGYDVTTIGKAAFSGCTSLTGPVYIGCNVTSIGNNAFKDCPQLTQIIVCPDVPPALGTGALDNTNSCPIVVPSGKASVYRYASGWSNYASRIQ